MFPNKILLINIACRLMSHAVAAPLPPPSLFVVCIVFHEKYITLHENLVPRVFKFGPTHPKSRSKNKFFIITASAFLIGLRMYT